MKMPGLINFLLFVAFLTGTTVPAQTDNKTQQLAKSEKLVNSIKGFCRRIGVLNLNNRGETYNEFQKAIAENNLKLSVDLFSNGKTTDRVVWVATYLYYFGTYLQAPADKKLNPYELILKPAGAKDLIVSQRRFPSGQ